MNTATEKYNGWANYETWACKLWLDNEQGAQELQQKWVKQAKATPKNEVWTRGETDKFTLSDKIKEYVEFNNLLDGEANMYADLLHSAIQNINFNEIAENILSDK